MDPSAAHPALSNSKCSTHIAGARARDDAEVAHENAQENVCTRAWGRTASGVCGMMCKIVWRMARRQVHDGVVDAHVCDGPGKLTISSSLFRLVD